MIGEELVFFSFLYIKLFELGVEVAFNNQFTVTHHMINLLKVQLQSGSSERTDDAFGCIFASASFTSRNPWSLSVD